MSARWDRTQGLSFYYGNATRDLADLLPPEGEEELLPSADEILAQRLGDLNGLIDQAQEYLDRIQTSRREISFLLSDLKRLLRNSDEGGGEGLA